MDLAIIAERGGGRGGGAGGPINPISPSLRFLSFLATYQAVIVTVQEAEAVTLHPHFAVRM